MGIVGVKFGGDTLSMLGRQHQLSPRYLGAEPNHDELVLRIRRLHQHRAFDRATIGSPLLRRLVPGKTTYGQPFPEADLRRALQEASLDGNAVSYLLLSIEVELDLAHVRLSEA